MTDIVYRLRDDDHNGDPALAWEAADVIERLQSRVERLENLLMMGVMLHDNVPETKSEMSWLVQAKDLLGLWTESCP